jgi:hypothetical protein
MSVFEQTGTAAACEPVRRFSFEVADFEAQTADCSVLK